MTGGRTRLLRYHRLACKPIRHGYSSILYISLFAAQSVHPFTGIFSGFRESGKGNPLSLRYTRVKSAFCYKSYHIKFSSHPIHRVTSNYFSRGEMPPKPSWQYFLFFISNFAYFTLSRFPHLFFFLFRKNIFLLSSLSSNLNSLFFPTSRFYSLSSFSASCLFFLPLSILNSFIDQTLVSSELTGDKVVPHSQYELVDWLSIDCTKSSS